jgi:rare lipoprotein A (peptidoglycan hydrolase)
MRKAERGSIQDSDAEEIPKRTYSCRIVLVLERPFYAGAALVAASLALVTGCGRHGSARAPVPAQPAPIGWTETGIASWYGPGYDGRPTASGEIFDMRAMTAAHRKLPFNTWLEVTNLKNGKQVEVRVTDRGPFKDGRILDLSFGAAERLQMVRDGIVRVHLKVIPQPNPKPVPSSPSEAAEPAGSPEPSGPAQPPSE